MFHALNVSPKEASNMTHTNTKEQGMSTVAISDGITEAQAIIMSARGQLVFKNPPAHDKLVRITKYLAAQQAELLAE